MLPDGAELRVAQSGVVTAEPGVGPEEPEFVPAEPRFVPAEPRFVPAEPGIVPAEPGFVPAERGFVPAEPGIVRVQLLRRHGHPANCSGDETAAAGSHAAQPPSPIRPGDCLSVPGGQTAFYKVRLISY